jgi:hypothetical protein
LKKEYLSAFEIIVMRKSAGGGLDPDISYSSKSFVELGGVSNFAINSVDVESADEIKRRISLKREYVAQMPVPVYQKKHFWSPDFVKCEGKIIKYNMRALGVWRVRIRSVYFVSLFSLLL